MDLAASLDEWGKFCPQSGFKPKTIQSLYLLNYPDHRNLGVFFYYHGATALSGPGSILIIEVSVSHLDTPQSVGLLWTSDQLFAQTST